MSEDVYLSTKEVKKILPLMSLDLIRSHGKKNWRKKKLSNRWYFHKDDISYPNWPIAKWQRDLFIPVLADDSDTPENYYEAMEAFHSVFGNNIERCISNKAIHIIDHDTEEFIVITCIAGSPNIISYQPPEGMKWMSVIIAIEKAIDNGTLQDFIEFSP